MISKPYVNENDEWCVEENGKEIVFENDTGAKEYYEAHEDDDENR